MVDIFSKSKRSEIMSKIGPKDSAQELLVRKLVFSMGYRYRLHRKDLPGSPDIVFPKYKKVIFVHGCFWHGHKKCKRAVLPENNRAFWERKICGNIARDKQTYAKLKEMGWQYLTIWQCEIKEKESALEKRIENFICRD